MLKSNMNIVNNINFKRSENNGAMNIMSNVPSVGSTKQNDNQELFFSDI